MKIGGEKRHKPIITALKEAGYTVETLEQQGKKIVITVSQAKKTASKRKKKEDTTPYED